MQSQNRLFVISTGRTGSTFITKLLKSNGHAGIEHQQIGSRRLNIFSNISWQFNVLEGFGDRHLVRKFGDGQAPYSSTDPLKSIALTHYLKRNPNLEAKIIVLVRDPRTFVSSFMNWKSSSLKRKILHHWTPFWQPMSFLNGKSIRLNKFKHFCWIWTMKNSLFLSSFAADKRALFIRYEDLMNPSTRTKTLKDISFHLGVELDKELLLFDKKVNDSRVKVFPNWQSWDPNQVKILNEYCGKMMIEFGYGNEDEWQNKLKS